MPRVEEGLWAWTDVCPPSEPTVAHGGGAEGRVRFGRSGYGTYKLSVMPTKNTYYKAVFGGNKTLGLGDSSSASTLVTVN